MQIKLTLKSRLSSVWQRAKAHAHRQVLHPCLPRASKEFGGRCGKSTGQVSFRTARIRVRCAGSMRSLAISNLYSRREILQRTGTIKSLDAMDFTGSLNCTRLLTLAFPSDP